MDTTTFAVYTELIEIPPAPTEDDLPYSDDMPMDATRHRLQIELLEDTLVTSWQPGRPFSTGGNLFVYFSPHQLTTHDYKGPDFFVALDVPPKERKSWLVWQEGKGPDVVIELLSSSTARFDRTDKKLVYQNQMRVPEYFWYDPFSGELAGFVLQNGQYQPLQPDSQGHLTSTLLELRLVRWEGTYRDLTATWVRWETPDGELLLTEAERERQRAEQERQRAEQAEQRAADVEAILARYREKFGNLEENA